MQTNLPYEPAPLSRLRSLLGSSAPLEVRLSQSPLNEDGDAAYTSNAENISRLSQLPEQGGLVRCLSIRSPEDALRALDARIGQAIASLTASRCAYIFGAHLNGAKCLRLCRQLGIKILGFIDNDPHKRAARWYEMPVIELAAVPDRAVAVINSSGRHAVEIDGQLARAGFHNRLHFMDLLAAFDQPFQAERGFRKFVSEVILNRYRYLTLYLVLADDKSRRILDDILQYRLTLSSHFARRACDPFEQEFFCDELIPDHDRHVFVDGGAYDGDSMARFVRKRPQFQAAHLYEPDADICLSARSRFASDPRVHVYNAGLYSTSGEASFSSTGGMDGAIVDQGESRIPVVSIDAHLEERITYLKLDVEGSEHAALEGARAHICNDRPFLALAAYHRPGDLWRLAAVVESFGVRYRWYLRHYSETMDDSILYGIAP